MSTYFRITGFMKNVIALGLQLKIIFTIDSSADYLWVNGWSIKYKKIVKNVSESKGKFVKASLFQLLKCEAVIDFMPLLFLSVSSL